MHQTPWLDGHGEPSEDPWQPAYQLICKAADDNHVNYPGARAEEDVPGAARPRRPRREKAERLIAVNPDASSRRKRAAVDME